MKQSTKTKPRESRDALSSFEQGLESFRIGGSMALFGDCFKWFEHVEESSIHAIVTDPPYGVKEYEFDELERMKNGTGGGIWRLPPVLNGHERAPLPRFTALTPKEREEVWQFFIRFGAASLRALRPGGHLMMACNAFMSQLVFGALVESGLEFRTEIIRLVQTLRGGDRPKNFEKEFPEVCSLPKGGYEPWGVFRKPIPQGMRVGDCLREFETGGLRRRSLETPFFDVIISERTPKREREIAEHPSLKPQSLMRQLVHAALPLGRGVVLDPFMGSGSTLAAAEAVGYRCIGIERHREYFDLAKKAIPALVHVSGSRVVSSDQIGLPL